MRLSVGVLLLFVKILNFSTLCTSEVNVKCDRNNSCINKDVDDGISFLPCIRNNQNDAPDGVGKCPNIRSSDVVLSRKRRALAFPMGSNFVMTISLVKALLIGLPLGWNIALEGDVLFPSPGLQDLLRFKYPRLLLHSRQRRELWSGIEDIFNVNGLNGESCLLNIICEAKDHLAPKGSIFVHDIFRILLTVPENGEPNDRYKKASKARDCSEYNGEKKCPFSPLKLLLSSARFI